MADTTPPPAEGWEVFTHRRGRVTDRIPLATIQSKGNLTLNLAAYQAMGEPAAVELLYNRSRNLLGIRPTDDTALPHAYKLRESKKTSTRALSLIAFAQFYGIPMDDSTSRRYSVDVQGNMLIIDLNQTPTVVDRARPSKSDA